MARKRTVPPDHPAFAGLTVRHVTLAAGLAQNVFSEAMIAEMTATGGVMILAIGLLLLDVRRIRVANLLPALLIAPLMVAALVWLGISL